MAELDAPDCTNATTRVLGDADQGIEELDVNSVALSKLTSLLRCMGGHWGGQLCLGVTMRLWLLRDPSYSQRNANICTPQRCHVSHLQERPSGVRADGPLNDYGLKPT